MNFVIAKRATNKETEVGFVSPIYLINEKNEIESTGSVEKRKERFPNTGTIIIHREYYYLYEDFDQHEFFLLEIEEAPNFEEYIPHSCKYQSLDGNTGSVFKMPLLINKRFSLTEQITLPYYGHKYVFIEDGGFVYGPISIFQPEKAEISANGYTYNIEPLNTEDLGLRDEYESAVFKFERAQLEDRVVKNLFGKNDTEEYYIYGHKEIVKRIKPVEYILNETNQEIIDWAATAFPEGFSQEKKETWLSVNDGNNIIDQIRLKKLTELKEKTSSWINFLDSYLTTKYIGSAEGQTKIEQYIYNNKEDLIKDYELRFKKEIQDKNKDLTETLQSLEKTKLLEQAKLKNLEEDIERLKNQKDLLYAKSEELNRIEQQITDKTEHLNIVNDFKKIKEDYTRIQATIHTLMTSVDEKRRELTELQNEYFEEAQKGSHKKIVELMPYVKALTGYFPDMPEDESKKNIPVDSLSKLTSDPFELEQYISHAKAYLDSKNRTLSEIEIGNILTCIHQNFLTIFSGLPGVGKSSLSNLISSLIAPKELSIDIPVGRGWNSKKNLLGFYNSLKGEYQKDEFGILERLTQINNHPDYLKSVPFIVILDEANLSPIEHYWADFLGVCDKDSDRSIHINDPLKSGHINLPDGFRFIFTINNDHTTEILSPRLLDRSSIIKLDYDPQKSPELNFISNLTDPDLSYHSFSSIKSVFLPESFSLNQAEKRIFTDIINILGDKDAKLGKQVPISPRKIKTISLYCSVTRKLYHKYHDNQFLALDYAILQNIVPLINGHGKSFEQRLERVKEECFKRSLLKSAQEIDEIITRGKEFQNYTFF